MKMKTISNHKWMILGAVLLALAVVLPMAGSVFAAPPAGDTSVPVVIPAEVKYADGITPGYVSLWWGGGDIGHYTNGQTAFLKNGSTYGVRFNVNNYTGPMKMFTVNGTAPITITAADYCKMKVLVDSKMKNLDGTSGYVTFYGMAGQYLNNAELYFPMGADVSWYITINDKKSAAHHKIIDCTPLDSGEYPVVYGSYCKMKINVPAELQTLGAQVRIYGISQTFTGDGSETVVLPMGQTITWYLKINGKEVPHTGKPVDCTPVNVTAADYCTVVNNTGQTINIYNNITLDNGESVVLPMGANIEWKYATARWPGTKKNVDCTPIVP